MDATGGDDGIELVARRLDFLEALADGPVGKPELVERLDHSRSTVDRAIRELEAADLVERETRGWVATQAGRLAARRYRAFRSEQSDILGARDVLAAIPHEYDVPASLVTGADVATGDTARGAVDRLADRLREVDTYRAVLPTVADSRHLRLLHDRAVRDGLDATLTVPEATLERLTTEFPSLVREFAAADGTTVRTADTPEFGVVLTGDTDPAATVLAGEDGATSGYVKTDDPDGVAWARDVVDAVAEAATDATDDLRDADGDGGLAPLTVDRLPTTLRSEGFVRLDETAVEGRDPLDPATAWRAGLDFPEIGAGYAIERRYDDGESVVDRVSDKLAGGASTVLLGPPGSGKSTVCKQVALARYEAGDTVLYRESGAGQPFESVGTLERYLDEAPGRTVVVVEDAARPDASGVFEVLASVAGREDAAFLFDSRDSEWYDEAGRVEDARTEAFRRRAVEAVPVPQITDADCERFVERVETVSDVDLPVGGEELYRDVVAETRTDSPDGEPEPGRRATTAFGRLSRYVAPLRDDDRAPDSLDEDVDAVRSGLAERGETARDVGFLVNLLNVAGLAVEPLYAYAVVTDDGENDRVRSDGIAAVASALDWLDGQVLFERDRESYGTVHETWSARYLERHLREEGEVAARRRFERCASRLLALAEDPERRRSLATVAGPDVTVPAQVLTAPTEWAATTARSLYGTGREYPKLAPLYGTADSLGVALPAVCDDGTRAACFADQGWTNLEAGNLDRAEAAFESLVAVDDAESATAVEGLRGLAAVARRRGDAADAAERASELLDLVAETDDRRDVALARLAYAKLSRHRGDLARAHDHLTAAEDTFEELEDRGYLAAVAEERGRIAQINSALDEAVAAFERSRDRYRDVEDDHGAAIASGELGVTALLRGETETAEQYLRQALEAVRVAGDRTAEARYLEKLGGVAADEGRLDEALSYYRRSADIAREAEFKTRLQMALKGQATVHRVRGDVERAETLYERAAALTEETGNREVLAATLTSQATLKIELYECDRARELITRSLETCRDIGARLNEAENLILLGRVELLTGDTDVARDRLEEARALCRDIDNRHREAIAANYLAKCHLRRSELCEALACVRQKARTRSQLGMRVGFADRKAGRIAMASGAFDHAVEHLQTVREHAKEGAMQSHLADTAIDLARARRRSGDTDGAGHELSEAETLIEELSDPTQESRYEVERAALAREREQFEDARRSLERAEALSEVVELPYSVARVRTERGRLERDCGDPTAARAAFRAAIRLYDDVGTDHRVAAVADELADVCEESGASRAAERARTLARERDESVESPPGEALEHPITAEDGDEGGDPSGTGDARSAEEPSEPT